MKKLKILVLMILAVLLSACSIKKEAIDEDDFIRIMTNEGFEVVNTVNEYTEYPYFEETYVAKKDGYEIQFYELEDDSFAKKIYSENKQQMESTKTGTYVESNVDLINNNKYSVDTQGVYTVVSRTDDTIVYLSVNSKFKEEVNSILKKLGY